MITAQPVALAAAGRNAVSDGKWMLEMTGKTISGSCRQLTCSGSARRSLDPGAPSGQSGMETGCDDSAAGADGIGGPFPSRLIGRVGVATGLIGTGSVAPWRGRDPNARTVSRARGSNFTEDRKAGGVQAAIRGAHVRYDTSRTRMGLWSATNRCRKRCGGAMAGCAKSQPRSADSPDFPATHSRTHAVGTTNGHYLTRMHEVRVAR